MWVPQVPGKPGLYANRIEEHRERKNSHQSHLVTPDLERTMQFESQDDCVKWCEDHPSPPFEAVEV